MKMQQEATFSKRGNECQYTFNEEVKDKIREAADVLDGTPPEVDCAKALLKEEKELLVKQQEHIKLADHSEHDWAAVRR